MRRVSFMPALYCIVSSLGLPAVPALAQAERSATAQPAGLLDAISYDAAQRGPLLLIEGPDVYATARSAKGKDSLPALTEALGRKVVSVGSLTVIAPKTMRIMEDHPGKPDPLAGLRSDELFKVLLSLFTPAQWAQAGSARGIGIGDLNDQQRALFAELLPEKLVTQRVRPVPGDEPHSIHYDYQGKSQEFAPNMARLRLVRQTSFMFAKEGANEYGYGASASQTDTGEDFTILPFGGGVRADHPQEGPDVLAMGVPVIRTVPSSLKRSQLNFKSGKFQAPVALDGNVKTLNDLLQRVAQVTRMELACDKRIADLPVLLQIAPGQSAKAGDILQTLCWSVTGTFRQVGASTFLLTDDVQGIGTRFQRLDEWAEEASAARYKTLEEIAKAAAKNDPLSFIKFASNDPLALPPDLLKRVDDAYRSTQYTPGPEINPAALPETLRKSLEFHREAFTDDGTKLRTDRVRIGTQLSAQYVLPNGTTVETPFAQNIGSQYLQSIAIPPKPASPSPAAPAATPAPPEPMPSTLKKRVLLADLPPDAKSIAALLAAAASKGFTEIWLRVLLDDANAPERLTIAVVAGKPLRMRVGVTVSLLRKGGLPGEEDVNIYGETGAQFAARRTAGKPELRDELARMAGWHVLDADTATPLLTRLAQVSGLCAFTLKATAAPGCAGDPGGGDGIWPGGHLGYDVETRLACIRKEGFDPIDTAPYSHNLSLSPSLPFFEAQSEEGLWKTLYTFKFTRNKQALARIYAALHQTAPDLPLYLDDRVSAYADPNLSWYGKWDVPERIPINPIYWNDSEGREKAFAGSSEPLLNLRGRYGNPESLARAVGRVAARAAKDWRGFTLDLTDLTPPQTLRMLDGLPAQRKP